MRKPKNYWTLERCKESASKYETKVDWLRAEKGAYAAALRNGWMPICSAHMRPLKNAPLKDRFDEKCLPVSDSGCWIWTENTNYLGYGLMKVNGKNVAAHRLSYKLHIGDIPEGMHVLHKCDVRPCVNPSHLFLGTHADNMRDMAEKGRTRDHSGENNYRAKLTWDDVNKIRRLHKTQKINQSAIAREYGVNKTTISCICNNKTWRHK